MAVGGGAWAAGGGRRGATFARGGSSAIPRPGTRCSCGSERAGGRPGPSRGPGAAAAMDIPPLAGKVAALSLGALPVSYALNRVSALSQCVRGRGGEDAGRRGPGMRAGPRGVGAGRERGCL